jgi:hypothetical protein
MRRALEGEKPEESSERLEKLSPAISSMEDLASIASPYPKHDHHIFLFHNLHSP